MRFSRSVAAAKLAVGWLTMFMMGTELFVFSPLLPILAADFHVSTSMAGLSVTTFSLIYMLTAPLFGRLSDSIGRRRMLICCLFAFAVANLLTSVAASLPMLLAIRVIAGAAAAGISPSVYALIGGAAPPDQRATWMAVVVSGLLFSLALGASAGALVASFLGWPSIFAALAAMSLMLLWFNRQIWPDEGGSAASAGATAASPLAAVELTFRVLPTVLWSTSLYAVYTYLGAGLAGAGFSSSETAEAVVLYGCGAIVGILAGGRIADKAGVKLAAGSSFAGLCAGFLLLRLAIENGTLIGPALGICSAVAQLFFPAQQAGLVKDFPDRRATVLAWNNSALFCGISLGSVVGGGAIALGSFGTDLTVSAGIALIGCLMNAAVVPGLTAAVPEGHARVPG